MALAAAMLHIGNTRGAKERRGAAVGRGAAISRKFFKSLSRGQLRPAGANRGGFWTAACFENGGTRAKGGMLSFYRALLPS